MSKKYGLIVPSKSSKKEPTKTNIFDDDSDDEETETDWLKKSLKRSQGSMQQKQATQVIKKALQDDPTVYQYDEVYDAMDKKREESKKDKKQDKQPKYIKKLLDTAKARQMEYEKRIERQVQKEREEEGDMYQDKEAFVTSAYRKKMEEHQKAEEEEKRKEALDELTDVTKQKDLSGFYRHLYKQQLGTNATSDVKTKPEPSSSTSQESKPDEPRRSPSSQSEHSRRSSISRSRSRSSIRSTSTSAKHKHPDRSPERYRSEKSYSSRDKERRRIRRRSTERNVASRRYGDRSPRRRRSRSRSYERRDYGRRDRRESPERRRRSRDFERRRGDGLTRAPHRSRSSDRRTRHRDRSPKTDKSRDVKGNKPKEMEMPTSTEANDKSKENEDPVKPVKPSIWTKRTIGKVFDDALQRYLIRKQSKML